MTVINHGLAAALVDVINERFRQLEVEGFDADHDDEHLPGELARAAASYALSMDGGLPHDPPVIWPWARKWWKPKGRRRDYVRAAALLIAEIEHLDRAAARAGAPE